MKLKKIKKDIIESIKSSTSKVRNEEFDFKVQAFANPSFVGAIENSRKNRELAQKRMKEKNDEQKEFIKATVERKANATPKTDAMKKMKMIEKFIKESFKDKLTINENIFTVTTKSRAELKKLIENARKHEVKYTIERINEGYKFNYKFESLNKELNEERKYVAGFFSKGKKDSYTEMSSEKWNSLDSDVKVKDLLDMWWNSVRIKGKGIKGEALLYKDCHDGSYELDEEHNSHGEDILNMTVHTHSEYDEDGDGYPIIYAKLLSKDKKLTVEKAKNIAYDKLSYGDYKNLMTMDDDYIIDYVSTELVESKDSTLKEEYALQRSPYKDIIGRHFNYSVDFEFLDIIALILDRIDFEGDLEDEIEYAIDSALFYIDDLWTIAKHYASTPENLVWSDVLTEFAEDIHNLVEKISDKKDLGESKTVRVKKNIKKSFRR